MQDLSYENKFDLHENEPVGGTRFHMNGIARSLVLTQRPKATRKFSHDVTAAILVSQNNETAAMFFLFVFVFVFVFFFAKLLTKIYNSLHYLHYSHYLQHSTVLRFLLHTQNGKK